MRTLGYAVDEQTEDAHGETLRERFERAFTASDPNGDNELDQTEFRSFVLTVAPDAAVKLELALSKGYVAVSAAAVFLVIVALATLSFSAFYQAEDWSVADAVAYALEPQSLPRHLSLPSRCPLAALSLMELASNPVCGSSTSPSSRSRRSASATSARTRTPGGLQQCSSPSPSLGWASPRRSCAPPPTLHSMSKRRHEGSRRIRLRGSRARGMRSQPRPSVGSGGPPDGGRGRGCMRSRL